MIRLSHHDEKFVQNYAFRFTSCFKETSSNFASIWNNRTLLRQYCYFLHFLLMIHCKRVDRQHLLIGMHFYAQKVSVMSILFSTQNVTAQVLSHFVLKTAYYLPIEKSLHWPFQR